MPVHVRPAVVCLVVFSAITGVLYPLLVTVASQALFPHRANGSMVRSEGRLVGSELIGQPFTAPRYFWGRPSATAPVAYNAAASGGSNLGPSNPALVRAAAERVGALRADDPAGRDPIPVDLVTASGSGLDPHISPAAAQYQVPRVARARGMSEAAVRELVARHTEGRQWRLMGEARVCVLTLNLALDAASRSLAHPPRMGAHSDGNATR
jgi:K+-transporting ATPase ATPase C chain